jgi:hypothetical protein
MFTRCAAMVAFAMGFVSMSVAQQNPMDLDRATVARLERESYRHVDGRQNPELVPYGKRMRLFFEGLKAGMFQQQLSERVSPEDLAKLLTYSESDVRVDRRENREAYMKGWADLSSRAEHMNAQEIAGEATRIDRATEERDAARYRSYLNDLTPAARKAVEDFAFVTIRPMFTTYDHFVMANAQPEFYKSQILAARDYLSGKKPWPQPVPGSAAEAPIQNSLMEDASSLKSNSP